MGKNKKRGIKRIRDFAAYLLFRIFAWFVGLLPEKAAVWLGCLFGQVFWLYSPKRRHRAQQNIAKAYGGELPEKETWRLAKESFIQTGLTVVETLWTDQRIHRGHHRP